jgi:tetratricopeptide (TPR) repeat protein
VIPPSIHAPGGSADEDVEEFEVVEEADDEPVVAAPARESSGPRPSEPKRPEPKRKVDPEPPKPAEVEDESDDLDAFDGRRTRRGISPGLIAFLGVIAAVGVMFGVPSIRTKLLSLGQNPTTSEQPPAKPVIGPEIAAADRALEKLGTAALARAEADLQRAIDAGKADPVTIAAMKVTLADLLLSRWLLYEMAAALDADQRDSFRRRAADDRDQGKRLIEAVQGGAADALDLDRLAAVRALARLAAGRPEAEVLLTISDAAIETQLIVKAAILWQDLEAPVPIGLVAGLSDLKQRSGLGESTLALALARAGDEVAARNTAERLLVGAEDQVVALAIRARLGEPTSGETGDGQADPPDQPETPTDPNVAKAPPRPGEDGGTAGTGGSGASGGSFDKLVERGCSQVKNGEAEAGIKTLMKAFDMKANDLDVLVCLGDGHAARGQSTQAVTFYDRALAQSPSNIPALRGAAKLAAKSGASERAKDLYERLLAADPHNAVAKAYLAKNTAQDAPPTEPDKESGG